MLTGTRRYHLQYLTGVRAAYGGSAATLLDSYLQKDAGLKHAANLPVSQRYFYMKNSKSSRSQMESESGKSQLHQMIQLRLGAAQMLSSSHHRTINNSNEAHPLYYAQTSPREAGLTVPLVLSLKRLRIHQLTELQGAFIPLLLKGHHVIAHSETGTGKSFGIALAISNRIIRDQLNYRLHTVVLVPTEELALQYDKWLRHFGGCTGQVVQAAIESIPLELQLGRLHNIQPHVLVGTPQRIADVMRLSPSLLGEKLRRKVDCVVLDEADLIIHASVKYGRQVISGANLVDRLFRGRREEVPAQLVAASATVDGTTAQVLNGWVRNSKAVRLTTSFVEHTIPPTIQFYFFGATRAHPLRRCLEKMLQLICKQHGNPRILIFTETESVGDICCYLNTKTMRDGIMSVNEGVLKDREVAAVLHALPSSENGGGNKDRPRSGAASSKVAQCYDEVRAYQMVAQGRDVYVKNNSSLSLLNEGKLLIGVGSFGMSRGLHVNGITHVILYGPCPPTAAFVHCVGRTGRMGADGDAVVIFPPSSGRRVQQVCHALELPFHPGRMQDVERLLCAEACDAAPVEVGGATGQASSFATAESMEALASVNTLLHASQTHQLGD